jgi:hypothetical protein
MLVNHKANTILPLKIQLEVDEEQDQNILASHKLIR